MERKTIKPFNTKEEAVRIALYAQGFNDKFGKECVDILLNNVDINLRPGERYILEELYSRFYNNPVTAAHMVSTAIIASRIYDESTIECNKHDFVLGMAVHDVGKLLVDPVYLTSGKYYDEYSPEKLEIDRHSVCGVDAFNLLFDDDAAKIFLSPEIQNIINFHHDSKIEYDNLGKMPINRNYINAAEMIDIFEAMSDKGRKYSDEDKSLIGVCGRFFGKTNATKTLASTEKTQNNIKLINFLNDIINYENSSIFGVKDSLKAALDDNSKKTKISYTNNFSFINYENASEIYDLIYEVNKFFAHHMDREEESKRKANEILFDVQARQMLTTRIILTPFKMDVNEMMGMLSDTKFSKNSNSNRDEGCL